MDETLQRQEEHDRRLASALEVWATAVQKALFWKAAHEGACWFGAVRGDIPDPPYLSWIWWDSVEAERLVGRVVHVKHGRMVYCAPRFKQSFSDVFREGRAVHLIPNINEYPRRHAGALQTDFPTEALQALSLIHISEPTRLALI
eukprot:8442694-Alexandrium_andersonii.AAC.1